MPINQYYEDEILENIAEPKGNFTGKEFESCTFEHCDFTESDFSFAKFTDCRFSNCNLSMIILKNTALRDVTFQNCKLVGVDFSPCNDLIFDVNFQVSVLNFSTFTKTNMKATKFIDCQIQEANFTQTNLSEAILDNCDLTRSTFHRCNFTKANLKTASNFIINPTENTLKKARFSLSNIPGLLANFDIIID